MTEESFTKALIKAIKMFHENDEEEFEGAEDIAQKIYKRIAKLTPDEEIEEDEPYTNMARRDLLYQISGYILTDGEDVALSILKNKQTNWEAPCFSEAKVKLEEFESYLVNPIEVADGAVSCTKCGSEKTYSFQRQIRSGDEPMTTFVTCAACKHQSKYSG